MASSTLSAEKTPHYSVQGTLALGRSWLSLLCILLAGYAFFGKGWAYLGVPPLYIGEAVLLAGLAWFVLGGALPARMPEIWLMLLMAAWGAYCTLPYLPHYGVNALRDSVIWGYGLYAIVVCGNLVADPDRVSWLIDRFRKFSLVFIWVMPALWVVIELQHDRIPVWPWAQSPIIHPKGGDILVHCAGILAFWCVGLGGKPLASIHLLPLSISLAIIGTTSRSGLLSFLLVFAICFACRPMHRTLWQLISIGLCGLTVLVVTQIELDVEQGQNARTVSGQQLIENVISVGGSSDAADLDNTKAWRLAWWRKIVDYTVHGPHFWSGKGYGINLSVDDGFQVEDHFGTLEGSRSPHNGHMTILARSGVPGLVLWVLVHGVWVSTMLLAMAQSHFRRQRQWTGLFAFLLLYWVAFMVNGSFDVYLEGPMGGIWLWSIYGIGLAALFVYRHYPETLVTAASENGSSSPSI